MKKINKDKFYDINIYADESCHLENDKINNMILGCVYCYKKDIKRISNKIIDLKKQYKIIQNIELKWTKVSPSNLELYKKVVDLFCEEKIAFRGWISPKNNLEHKLFNQTYDDWYYKMYYNLLTYIISESIIDYNIYIDIKDTISGRKVSKLEGILNISKMQNVNKVQTIKSSESQLMQITDIFIGAIGYKMRELETSKAKLELINYIEEKLNVKFNLNSTKTEKKFNIFHWLPQGL